MNVCLPLGGGPLEQLEQSHGHRAIEDRERRREQSDVSTVGVDSVWRSRRLAHADIVRPNPFSRVAERCQSPSHARYKHSNLTRSAPEICVGRPGIGRPGNSCPATSERVLERVSETLVKGFATTLAPATPSGAAAPSLRGGPGTGSAIRRERPSVGREAAQRTPRRPRGRHGRPEPIGRPAADAGQPQNDRVAAKGSAVPERRRRPDVRYANRIEETAPSRRPRPASSPTRSAQNPLHHHTHVQHNVAGIRVHP